MSLVIKIVDDEYDLYIEEFLPDLDEQGRGHAFVTVRKDKAKQFADMEAALEFWKQQSKRRPLRPDGKPNRPLTAYTVTFEHVDEEGN
jgi:hypothetical protein